MISKKGTILCLLEVLRKYSDENHGLSTEIIQQKLKQLYDVDMERRAVYRNIEVLREFGYEIPDYEENREGYYLLQRQFEPYEVRLLCDAVSSSNIISKEATKQLIKKLIATQSIYEGRFLQRTLYTKPEGIQLNKQLFYNIDALNIAINQGAMVSAVMLKFDYDGSLKESEDGLLLFSPYATVWAKGQYYVLGKRDDEDELSHYRIDRLKDIEVTEIHSDIFFGGINPQDYVRKELLGESEDQIHAVVEAAYSVWEDIIDGFREFQVLSVSEEKLRIRITASKKQLIEWSLVNLENVELCSPNSIREELRSTIAKGIARYRI